MQNRSQIRLLIDPGWLDEWVRRRWPENQEKTKEKPSWQALLAVGSSLFSFICRRVLIQDQTGESVSQNEARRDPN